MAIRSIRRSISISETLLPEFGQEMANTRKTLERHPDRKFDRMPGEKSGSMGRLAGRVANMTEWAVETIDKGGFDMAPGGVQMQPPWRLKARKDLLDSFEKQWPRPPVTPRGERCAGAEAMPWSFMTNVQVLFSMPHIGCLRTWVMNHRRPHHAQLRLYLRLNNLPIPAIYLPSTDEGQK